MGAKLIRTVPYLVKADPRFADADWTLPLRAPTREQLDAMRAVKPEDPLAKLIDTVRPCMGEPDGLVQDDGSPMTLSQMEALDPGYFERVVSSAYGELIMRTMGEKQELARKNS